MSDSVPDKGGSYVKEATGLKRVESTQSALDATGSAKKAAKVKKPATNKGA